jgi:hypothetical protein
MTQPANPQARAAEAGGSDTRESRQNGDPQLAPGGQADDDEEQRVAWLRAGPEVIHPGTRGSRRRAIGLSALAIVVPGLAVAAMAHFPAPGPVTSEITAPPTGARPLARPDTSANAQPMVPPVLVDATVTSATTAEAPVSLVSPVPTASAAPEPDERLPIAGGATEHRSTSRHRPLASPPPSAPASPETTAARWPSIGTGNQEDTPPSRVSSDQQGNQSRWNWKKTTTCDSSGCADHYNPAPSGQ